MINSAENFQTVLALVLLYLQAVLDELAAMFDVETASLYFVLFVADSLDYLVCDVFDITVRLVIHGSVYRSAAVVTEDYDKSRAEVLSGVLDASELVGVDDVPATPEL